MIYPHFRPDVTETFPEVEGRCQLALGNMTQYEVLVHTVGEWIVVAVLERGAYEFDGYAHWAYVMEKVGIKFEADARNLADFINDQLWHRDAMVIQSRRQGRYSNEFLSK
jgi:hypothetical protein